MMILIKALILISLIVGGGQLVPETPDTVASRPVLQAQIEYQSSVIQLRHVSTVPLGQGSAVVIHRDGRTVYAVTCNHCIPEKEIILFADGNVAFTVAQLPKYDLAVIKFNSDRHYSVASFATPRIDLPVRIIGWFQETRQIRQGTITNDRGQGTIGVAGGVYAGFSGGGVFDEQGRIVGIVSGVLVRTVPQADLGVVIRGDVVERFVKNALNKK
jgi:S1-C subfamily serine protease